jgi:hypothetical protein
MLQFIGIGIGIWPQPIVAHFLDHYTTISIG